RAPTLPDMRRVLCGQETTILFATPHHGRWQAYVRDFRTTLPQLKDLPFQHVERWPRTHSPDVEVVIAEQQIPAAAWTVADPTVTVVDVRRLQRTRAALNEFLDTMSGRDDLGDQTAQALKKLSGAISRPEGVDYYNGDSQ